MSSTWPGWCSLVREPPDRREELDLVVAQALLIVASIAVTGPALLIAVPLAMVIDRRGWRRWPALLTGAAVTAGAVAAGAWDTYLATVAEIWRAARHDGAFPWTHAFGLVPLAITAGVALGPVLQIAVHHRNEHEATRHDRSVSATRRARVQAERRMRTLVPPTPPDRTVLGLRLDGGIRGWQLHRRGGTLVAPPAEVCGRQALILGETGSGKTVTALTLAAELLRIGWNVHWIDGKADRDTRHAFLAAAAAAGIDARDGGAEPIDGWRGGPEAIVNRLLVTQDYSEKYYEGIARTVLRGAVGDDPPHSLAELVDRAEKKVLARALRNDRRAAELVHKLPDREIDGVRFRYEGIAWAIGTMLDGDWPYEDTHASYVPVGRPENRHQAAEVGAFLLEDLLHWALARKPRDRKARRHRRRVLEALAPARRRGRPCRTSTRQRCRHRPHRSDVGEPRPRRHHPQPPRRHSRHGDAPPAQAAGRGRRTRRHKVGHGAHRADRRPAPHRPRQPARRQPVRRASRRGTRARSWGGLQGCTHELPY